jgi:hypothetical protein
MIVLKPFGGLCNRLRLVASGLTLARQIGTTTRLVWKIAPDMVARFDELFEPVEGLTIVPNGRYRFVQSPHAGPPLLAPFIEIINRGLGVRYAYFEDDMPSIWKGDVDLRRVGPAETVFLCTCQSLVAAKDLDFRWVRPRPRMAARIEQMRVSLRGSTTLGVHVRRSDLHAAIRESPLELFVARIDDALRADPQVRIFLATDDPESERALVDRFGSDTIRVAPKQFGRESVEAIQDAVVDLFVLSQTHEIMASAYSSFSETAAVLGGIPLTIVRRPAAPV